LKLLVIEDNPDIEEILGYILNDDGHEVISSPDGSPLNFLDIIKPDVILMDDKLTESRGSELCLELKSNDRTKNIPVILTSAMPDLPNTAIRCKADAYLEKPFNIDILSEMIRSFARI
jgi:DNA-binding response OmpR family regulator